MNKFVENLWPKIAEHVAWRIRNEVEPIVNDKLFTPIRNVTFTRTSIGTRPVRVGNLKYA